MSMNLHARCGKEKFDLWQTPTSVTNMALVQADGSISQEVTGKKARRALYIYLEWVKATTDGVWYDLEENREAIKKLS